MRLLNPIYALPLGAVLAITASSGAQDTSAPPCKAGEVSQQKSPCTDAKEPSAAQKFPFPGESAPATPKQAPAAQNAPDAPPQSGKPSSTADQFPFPGSAPPMPGEEGSSSSSSSSSSSTNSDDPNANPGDKTPADTADAPRPSGRRRLPKIEKVQSDEERADEDLKVAKYYEQAGNLNAAYMRAKDAVKSLPDEAEMHFALAHVAEKMKKNDEAVAEYNAYLKMAPDGVLIKDARKALEKLEK
jgi:tetratricopeptide (TPR) repeat protein